MWKCGEKAVRERHKGLLAQERPIPALPRDTCTLRSVGSEGGNLLQGRADTETQEAGVHSDQ